MFQNRSQSVGAPLNGGNHRFGKLCLNLIRVRVFCSFIFLDFFNLGLNLQLLFVCSFSNCSCYARSTSFGLLASLAFLSFKYFCTSFSTSSSTFPLSCSRFLLQLVIVSSSPFHQNFAQISLILSPRHLQ